MLEILKQNKFAYSENNFAVSSINNLMNDLFWLLNLESNPKLGSVHYI